MNQKLYVNADIEKSGDKLVAIASTSVEDRHGEIVEVEGWDLKNYKKNPVIQWAHDHTQPAIGVAKKVWVDGAGKKARLMIEPMFQEVTELGRAIKQLVADGVIKTLSVGFKPIDQDGAKYTKQELLEVSFVNVPANPEAMMLSYKSLKDAGFKQETIERAGIPVALIEKVAQMEQRQQILETKVDTAVKGLQHLNPHQGRNQRIVKDRLYLAKVAVRAADKLRQGDPNPARLAKVVKRANEMLIVSLKGELNGKNFRTPEKG